MLVTTPVLFTSHGVTLAGRFYRNTASLFDRQPAVVVSGSWLTVKEQMAHGYAQRLAALGYTAFTFDFTGFGRSAGEPRQTEMPGRKIDDIVAATRFVNEQSFVTPGALGYVAICASAQYALAAIARGAPIGALACVAGWFHDTSSVAAFYGGDEGVQTRVAAAGRAVEAWLARGEIETAPAYANGDERAGMFFELDYYANARRGALPEWKNEMAVMSWLHWLAFDGLRAAEIVRTPSLFVHSDGCVFPDHVRRIAARLGASATVRWQPSGTQTDFYDLPEYVEPAVAAIDEHLRGALRGAP
jgi:uncharacterized protein